MCVSCHMCHRNGAEKQSKTKHLKITCHMRCTCALTSPPPLSLSHTHAHTYISLVTQERSGSATDDGVVKAHVHREKYACLCV